jgi:hypothetical protein
MQHSRRVNIVNTASPLQSSKRLFISKRTDTVAPAGILGSTWAHTACTSYRRRSGLAENMSARRVSGAITRRKIKRKLDTPKEMC